MEMQENQPFFAKKNSLFTLFSNFTAFSHFLCNKISLPVFAPKSPLSVPPSTLPRATFLSYSQTYPHSYPPLYPHLCGQLPSSSPNRPPRFGSPPSHSAIGITPAPHPFPLHLTSPPNTEERENSRPTRSNLSTSLPEGESRPMETGSVSADQESIRYRPPPPQPCATCTHRIHFASLLHEKARFLPQK